MKHTQGEWRKEEDGLRILAGHLVVADCEPDHITCDEDRMPGEEEALANAHLVKASPRLLAACRMALASFQATHDLQLEIIGAVSSKQEAEIAQLEAVIALAEGGA